MGDMFDDVMFRTMGAIAQEYNEEIMNSKQHYEYGQKGISPSNDSSVNTITMNKGDKGSATITAIQGNGTFNKNDGTMMYKQNVTLKVGENEITVEANSKTPEPPYKTGEKVEFECWGEYQGVPKCSIKKPREQSGGGRYNDPEVQKSILRQFAFREANLFLINHGYDSDDRLDRIKQTGEVADLIIKWVNNE